MNTPRKLLSSLSSVVAIILAFILPGIASAEGAVQPQGPSALIQILFFGGFILIFYFLMWRPQSKRAKEHRNLVSELSKGDEIVTNGGIAGKITKVTDEFVVVDVAPNVEIKIQKHAVASALPKGTLKSI